MANTTDSSSTDSHSLGSSNFSDCVAGGVVNSPTKLRGGNLPSPWSQVVRGGGGSVGDSSPASEGVGAANSIVPEQVPPIHEHPPLPRPPSVAPPENDSVVQNNGNGGGSNVGAGGRKAAWKKPSNGFADATANPVIAGASSWPALSESTRLSLKFSDESSKSATDGSTSGSMSQGPVTSDSHPKHGMHVNPNSSSTNAAPVRQRSMKRGGGGNRQVGFAHAPAPPPPGPPFPVTGIPFNSFGNVVPIISDASSREIRSIGGLASQSHPVNDHFVQSSSPQRGHFGQNARANGPHSNNYRARLDQEWRNYDWNSNPSLNVRDFHAHPRRANSRGYMRLPAQGIAPFVASQPVRPHGNPMFYHDISHPLVYYLPTPPEPFGDLFFPAPPPVPVYIQCMEPDFNLPFLMVKQIDYYFSDANLVTDDFLRSNMDDEGWVPIKLIANFPRVTGLKARFLLAARSSAIHIRKYSSYVGCVVLSFHSTVGKMGLINREVQNLIKDNIPFILESLRGSEIVEVQGDKIRRRDGWKKWIPQGRLSTNLDPQSIDQSTYDDLTTSIQEASLHNISINQDAETIDESERINKDEAGQGTN